MDERTTIDVVFAAISPHFSHADSRLSQLVISPSFKVLKASHETHNGQELIRVDYTYTYNVPGKSKTYQRRIRGSLYFDPLRCWCLRRFKDSRDGIERGEQIYKAELEYEYEVIDHPSGFPVIKKRTEHVINNFYKNKQKIDAASKTEYELVVKEGLPNSEFTLSAFRLPEPADMEPGKKPIPMYAWILITACVCAALALGFRYLARRARPKPAV